MIKIKWLQLGSSVRLNDKEYMGFNTVRDPVEITFDKGIFTVSDPKTGDETCFATTNVKYWKPDAAQAADQAGTEPKKRGRPAQVEA